MHPREAPMSSHVSGVCSWWWAVPPTLWGRAGWGQAAVWGVF